MITKIFCNHRSDACPEAPSTRRRFDYGAVWIGMPRQYAPPNCGMLAGRATDTKVLVTCLGHYAPLELFTHVITWVPCTSGVSILSTRH